MTCTSSTARTVDAIVYATGFNATLSFLDSGLLECVDGVPLRVAGMTLPVGARGGCTSSAVAAPRGPHLPVYSAQARLIAKFLAARERAGMALWATLAKGARPEARIDMPRDEWQRDMDGTHRRIDALLRRAPLAGSGQEPVGHNVMLRV